MIILYDNTDNTDKTKVLVFSRGNITTWPGFRFGSNELDIVDNYT